MSEAGSSAVAENGSQRADLQSDNGDSATRKEAYSAYLHSDAWRLKRLVVIDLAGGRCQVCNSPKRLDVHHRTYERIGEEAPGDLTVLCRKCHSLFHEKRGLSQAKPTKVKKPKRPKRKRVRQKKRKVSIESIQHIHREKVRFRVLKTKCPLCRAPAGINCTGIRPGFIHRERILKSEA